MFFKTTESHSASGKNTQTIEIEASDQPFKNKSLGQKTFPENLISIDEKIVEESKIREIEVIHLASYCFNFIAMVAHYCKFLKAKYQNLFCSFSTGDVI